MSTSLKPVLTNEQWQMTQKKNLFKIKVATLKNELGNIFFSMTSRTTLKIINKD